MDKWTELKDWINNGINNFDQLAIEAQFNYPNGIEYDRLMTRKREFEQFLQKMNEIEQMSEHKYQCLGCGVIATDKQWDEMHKIIYKEYGFTINDENRRSHIYVCPACGEDIGGHLINKIL
jgi:rubrerythrin